MKRKQIFISSVQSEFARARVELAAFINNDPYWNKYFYAFIFENLPASSRSPGNIYLSEIDNSEIYLGIFGRRYGKLNKAGISATEEEFDHASSSYCELLIFVKKLTTKARRTKRMQTLVKKAGASYTYTVFRNTDHLCSEVQRSLLYWGEEQNKGSVP